MVISLFVSANICYNVMFLECASQDKLKPLIYRSFNPNEEHLFLKYLSKSKHQSSEDLHVYYHILRSHFMEAFECHKRSDPIGIENLGLHGHQKASARNKLVYTVKKLLPDVYMNLINLCRKEKNNVWQQGFIFYLFTIGLLSFY